MTMNWPEAYRPTSLEEMALDPDDRAFLESCIEEGDIPSLVLSGPRGTGKTTLMRILEREVLGQTMMLNASMDRGIDKIRTDVRRFASAHTNTQLGGSPRGVLLDEAGGLTPEALDALRGVIDEYATRCRFIVATNYPERGEFEYIRSRLQWIQMDSPPVEERLRRLKEVLDAEGVKYTERAARDLAEQFTDMRPILHEAERHARTDDWELPTEIDVPETVVETVQAVARLEASDEVEMVSQSALMEELNLGRSTVSERVRRAHDERRLIDNKNPGPGTPADWRVTKRGRNMLASRS